MAVAQQKPMTVAEFLTWQLRQDELYELVDGFPQKLIKHRMMAGATRVHDGIVPRAIASLVTQLRGRPCTTFTDDIAIQIPKGGTRRPDVGVDCARGDPKDLLAADPRVVMEVLSPTTRTMDRLIKLEEYKTVPGLTTILLVDPEVPSVAAYRRQGDFWVIETFSDLGASVPLPEIACALTLADLYEGVEFPSHP